MVEAVSRVIGSRSFTMVHVKFYQGYEVFSGCSESSQRVQLNPRLIVCTSSTCSLRMRSAFEDSTSVLITVLHWKVRLVALSILWLHSGDVRTVSSG